MTPTDPVEHLARTVAVEAHAGPPESVDRSEIAPRVWWLPGRGVVVRHRDESSVFVVVSEEDGTTANGEYIDIDRESWPSDAEALSPDTVDWQRRALMWERFAEKVANRVDGQRFEAEQEIERAKEDAARARRGEAKAKQDRSEALAELAALRLEVGR